MTIRFALFIPAFALLAAAPARKPAKPAPVASYAKPKPVVLGDTVRVAITTELGVITLDLARCGLNGARRRMG